MKMTFITLCQKIIIISSLILLVQGCNKDDELNPTAGEESADVVYDWYQMMGNIQLKATTQPVVILNHRNFGYIGVGLYEAVQPGINGAASLSTKLYQMPQMPTVESNEKYLWSASANAALASMFKQFLVGLSDGDKSRIDSMENANKDKFKQMASDAVINRSESFGRAIASAIYNWSTTDNFNLSGAGYVLPVFPGSWVLTPPAYANPVGPFLKNSRPFLEYSLTATAPPLPIPYSEADTSRFFKAAKEVYDIGVALTAEQKATANWWADAGGAGVGVPAPYHLISIITSVIKSKDAKLDKAAKVFAKTGMGQKDGPIVTFRGKFQYNLIRPVTYIQQHINPTWQSYLSAPPYPEYPSGLAGLYMPVIQVLIREFGDIPVTDDAYVWRGIAPRQYPSLTKLMEEASLSRVYGGLHYQFTMTATMQMGKELGDKIADINL